MVSKGREPNGELVVADALEPCPYLPGRIARLPLRIPPAPLSPEQLDASLARGDRRVGPLLYRTECPACVACEPLRVLVAELSPSRSERRVLRRNRDLRIEVGPVAYSTGRFELFERHKRERGLVRDEGPMTRDGYLSWFANSCARTVEMRYLDRGRLLAVGIVDLGLISSSSVYFYFDPDEGRRSLGTLSVLVESAWLRERGGRYHYLGLHVAECPALSYKARFRPHERLVAGGWRRFD